MFGTFVFSLFPFKGKRHKHWIGFIHKSLDSNMEDKEQRKLLLRRTSNNLTCNYKCGVSFIS